MRNFAADTAPLVSKKETNIKEAKVDFEAVTKIEGGSSQLVKYAKEEITQLGKEPKKEDKKKTEEKNKKDEVKEEKASLWNPEKDAKLRISERKQGREAETTIDAMNDHEIKELGMIFNINTDHNTVEMIKDILLERCIKYPIKMHTLINNKEETAIRITIKRCIRTGILQEETGTGIKTSDGYIIGLNENMAIQTLKEDKDLLYRLDKESKARTGNNKKAETPESVTKPIKETNTVTN